MRAYHASKWAKAWAESEMFEICSNTPTLMPETGAPAPLEENLTFSYEVGVWVRLRQEREAPVRAEFFGAEKYEGSAQQ